MNTDELELIPAKRFSFVNVVVPMMAAAAMTLAVVLLFVVLISNSHNELVNCHTNQHFYNTFQAVIHNVEKPPTLAGKKPTAVQAKALHAYANNLRAALPAHAPVCG